MDEPVEQDPDPALEQRAHPLLDQLGARRGVEQRLRPGAHVQRRVLDQLADPLGHLDPARLAQRLGGDAALGQLLGQAGGQGRLARPVQALDGDQSSARHRRDDIYDQ